VTFGGKAVSHASVSIPRHGAWHAQVALTELEPVGDTRGTLQFGPNLALTGAIRRGGVADGAAVLLLLGGSGNLNRLSRRQAYRQAPLRLPLTDLLGVAEQPLAESSHQEVLNAHLAHWVLPEAGVGTALALLLSEVQAATWRMLSDGTLWVGTEGWAQAPAFDYVLTVDQPLENAVRLHSLEPAVLPGQTFRDRRVSYVHHLLQEDHLETTVYWEGA